MLESNKENINPQKPHHKKPQQSTSFFLDLYSNDIFNYLQKLESRYKVNPNYLTQKLHINDKMRAIVVDWMTEVHFKFNLMPETLFLGVNLLDRHLENSETPRNKLQLVGVVALELACKFEEVLAPQISDFIYISDKACTREQILQMELELLKTTSYNLSVPTCYCFLQRYSRLQGITKKGFYLGCYLLELSLTETKMLKYSPSELAGGALFLSNKILGNDPWPCVLLRHTPYNTDCLKKCARELCILLTKSKKSKFQAVRNKYKQDNYYSVAKIKVFFR